MRHELFNQDIVSQEDLALAINENDQMEETLPYTEEFFNSLGLEQVDKNNSPYVDVHNDSLEANTPHIKQKTTTRLGREVQKHKHLRDYEV